MATNMGLMYGMRNRKLTSMGYASYAEYLRSPHWQSMVRRYRKSSCEVCDGTQALSLHHRRYCRVGKENPDRDLITLCSGCHEGVHHLVQTGQAKLKSAHRVLKKRKQAKEKLQ